VDKLTLAALEATLRLYYDEEIAFERVPTLRMIATPPGEVERRAKALAEKLKAVTYDEDCEILVAPSKARTGGGSLPEVDLPSWAVAIQPRKVAPQVLEEFFRKFDPPIITRIEEDRLMIDLRTLQKGDDKFILEAWEKWLQQTKT